MLKAVVGHSNDPDSLPAITEVLEQCEQALAGTEPQAGVLFAAIDFDHALILQEIHQKYPEIQLIGGTTDGEISSVLGFEQDSLTLILFSADKITFRTGIGVGISQDLPKAIATALEQATLGHQESIELCLTVPDSLTTSGVLVLESLNKALEQTFGKKVAVFGGMTADQWEFQQNYQFCGTKVYSDAIPILLISGEILFAHGIASGWYPIGKKGVVTKADLNVVYEIDHKPALDFYHYYLDGLAPSQEYPLAVFDTEDVDYYIRASSGTYDVQTGSITFFGDVPEGAIVQITETTQDRILAASKASMEQALAKYPGKEPVAALYFSCASRKQILGSRTKEEYTLTQTCLTNSLPSCGFYTNGEISPLPQQTNSCYHNETFITLLLGES
ncbi:MAG: hypothetical protein HC916_17160 [Coleofasciculaceae cyanobacterium SM2_1_6]|nr:hypothetical protein [Coleofasciculaceae cyanobacterium SM2_1_6]